MPLPIASVVTGAPSPVERVREQIAANVLGALGQLKAQCGEALGESKPLKKSRQFPGGVDVCATLERIHPGMAFDWEAQWMADALDQPPLEAHRGYRLRLPPGAHAQLRQDLEDVQARLRTQRWELQEAPWGYCLAEVAKLNPQLPIGLLTEEEVRAMNDLVKSAAIELNRQWQQLCAETLLRMDETSDGIVLHAPELLASIEEASTLLFGVVAHTPIPNEAGESRPRPMTHLGGLLVPLGATRSRQELERAIARNRPAQARARLQGFMDGFGRGTGALRFDWYEGPREELNQPAVLVRRAEQLLDIPQRREPYLALRYAMRATVLTRFGNPDSLRTMSRSLAMLGQHEVAAVALRLEHHLRTLRGENLSPLEEFIGPALFNGATQTMRQFRFLYRRDLRNVTPIPADYRGDPNDPAALTAWVWAVTEPLLSSRTLNDEQRERLETAAEIALHAAQMNCLRNVDSLILVHTLYLRREEVEPRQHHATVAVEAGARIRALQAVSRGQRVPDLRRSRRPQDLLRQPS